MTRLVIGFAFAVAAHALYAAAPGQIDVRVRQTAGGPRIFVDVVCAAEGYVLVQAQEAGMMPLDFGKAATVEDALTGKAVGEGPVVNVDFRLGETRLFKVK